MIEVKIDKNDVEAAINILNSTKKGLRQRLIGQSTERLCAAEPLPRSRCAAVTRLKRLTLRKQPGSDAREAQKLPDNSCSPALNSLWRISESVPPDGIRPEIIVS